MSEQFLATASVRIIPDVTGFAAALQAEVAAATARVRIPAVAGALRANTVATRTFTAATGTSTIAVRQNAVALEQEGAAAATSAAETRLSAKAAREAAVAHSQMARGVATATASQFGLRGAVLASSGPFLAAVIAVETVVKSIDAYNAEAESSARVTAILGEELGRSAEEWAKQQAAIGLSAEAALKYQGAIAQVFTNVKIASDENAKFSENLVRRAADVAARANAPVTQVLRAFQLALSGNLRGLRQFVPAVSAATIVQQAFADTGKDVKANLTEQELVLARYEVLMERSANQAGSFADRSKNLAGETKILKSNLSNLGAELGRAVVPALTEVTSELVKFVAAMKIARKEVSDFFAASRNFSRSVETNLGFHDVTSSLDEAKIADRLREIASEEGRVTVATEQLGSGFTGLLDPIVSASQQLQFFVGELRAVGVEIASIVGSILSGTQEAVLRTQIGGGSLQAVLQAQQAAIAVARGEAAGAVVGAIGAKPGTKAGDAAIQARVDAEQALKDAEDAAASTQAQIAAAAKKGATARKKAGKTRQEILDEQDQALLDTQQFAQGQLDLAAAQAKNLQQQITIDKARIVLDERQIAQAKAQIHDEQLKKETIQALRIAEAGTRAEIKQLEADRKQAVKDAQDAAAATREESLNLDIEFAQTNKNVSAERRAHEALIAFLVARQQHTKKGTNEWKKLRNEIAAERQAIKALQKENAGLSSDAQFAFLTTQAGFVANLLGNLIPRGSTAGLVGGTSSAISTPTVPQPAVALSAAAQTAGGPRGASTGQMATLIHVQMQMLQAILRLTGQRAHPEATYQRYSAADDLNVATST